MAHIPFGAFVGIAGCWGLKPLLNTLLKCHMEGENARALQVDKFRFEEQQLRMKLDHEDR